MPILVLHAPVTDGSIFGQCAQDWPGEQARLAFRLRAAFRRVRDPYHHEE